MANGGQYFNHLVAARYRVVGSGVLESQVNSLDDTFSLALPNITLSATNPNYPNLNTNFKQQKIQLEISTDTFDAYFLLKQIILFMKSISTGIPQ